MLVWPAERAKLHGQFVPNNLTLDVIIVLTRLILIQWSIIVLSQTLSDDWNTGFEIDVKIV